MRRSICISSPPVAISDALFSAAPLARSRTLDLHTKWCKSSRGVQEPRTEISQEKLDAASELLKPYDARLMRCYPISTRINHVANDDEECSAPVELTQIQNRLFS